MSKNIEPAGQDYNTRQYFNSAEFDKLKPELGKGIYLNNKDKDGKDKPPYFPSIFTDPAIKQTKEYALANVKALYYNNWVTFNNAWGNNWRNRFIDNRNWSNGKQDIHAFVGGKKIKGDEKQNPLMKHLDFDPVTEQSKYRDIIVGYLEDLEFDVQANTLNPTAAAMRENKRLNEIFIHRMQQTGFTQAINQAAGQNVMPQSELPFPVSDEKEINLWHQLGGAKEVYELEIEVANLIVNNDSDYKQIWKMQLEDAFDCGLMVEDTIVDKDGRVKYKYVDPVNEGVEDYRGHYLNRPDRIWYMELKTIQEIYMEAEGQLTLKDMYELSRMYESKFGNPAWNSAYNGWNQYYNTDSNYNFGAYSTFFYSWKVPVLFSRISEVDMYPIIEYTNRSGYRVKQFVKQSDIQPKEGSTDGVRDYLRNIPEDSIYAPLAEQFTDENKLRVALGGDITTDRLQVHHYYRCTWIINTDYCYDFGRVPFAARDPYNPRYEQCPTRHYRFNQQPLAEKVRFWAKKIYNTCLKIDNELARKRPAGHAINIKALENIALGNGETLTVKHQMEILNGTGDLLYADEAQGDMLGVTRNKRIIDPIPQNGFAEAMKAYVDYINFCIQRIAATTGINEFMDASNPNPNTSVGVAQAAMNGTKNSMSQITSGFLFMAEKRALCVSEMVRKVVEKVGNYSGYADAMGAGMMSFVSVSPQVVPHRFGIKVSARPSRGEKEAMKQYIGQAFANLAGTEQGGLWVTDLLRFEEYVNAGLPFKLIRMMLAAVLEERMMKAQKDKMEMIDRQVQGNMQQQQQALSIEAQMEQMTTRNKMVFESFLTGEIIKRNNALAMSKGTAKIYTDSHHSQLKQQEEITRTSLGQ